MVSGSHKSDPSGTSSNVIIGDGSAEIAEQDANGEGSKLSTKFGFDGFLGNSARTGPVGYVDGKMSPLKMSLTQARRL